MSQNPSDRLGGPGPSISRSTFGDYADVQLGNRNVDQRVTNNYYSGTSIDYQCVEPGGQCQNTEDPAVRFHQHSANARKLQSPLAAIQRITSIMVCCTDTNNVSFQETHFNCCLTLPTLLSTRPGKKMTLSACPTLESRS
jgi:hypothetical protein